VASWTAIDRNLLGREAERIADALFEEEIQVFCDIISPISVRTLINACLLQSLAHRVS
jgi:hypothetical protein